MGCSKIRRVLAKPRLIFRRNVPFIRKVRVLFKTRLIFPRINGPTDTVKHVRRDIRDDEDLHI